MVEKGREKHGLARPVSDGNWEALRVSTAFNAKWKSYSRIGFEIFRGVNGATASIFFIEVEGNLNIVHLKFHSNRLISLKVMNNFLSKKENMKGDQNWASISTKSAPTEILLSCAAE